MTRVVHSEQLIMMWPYTTYVCMWEMIKYHAGCGVMHVVIVACNYPLSAYTHKL